MNYLESKKFSSDTFTKLIKVLESVKKTSI